MTTREDRALFGEIRDSLRRIERYLGTWREHDTMPARRGVPAMPERFPLPPESPPTLPPRD